MNLKLLGNSGRVPRAVLLAILLVPKLFADGRSGAGDDLLIPDGTTLNAIQIIGSHNSYKLLIAPELEEMIATRDPDAATQLHYEHEPVVTQLERGLRNLEVDVFYDPEGGRYADPLGLRLLGGRHPPFDRGAMLSPGYKVLHVQDIDFRSLHPTLADFLHTLRSWSTKNPKHLPVVVTMNVKEDPAALPSGVDALRFTPEAADALDLELRTHLGEEHLLTPDAVRGKTATLREAVLTRGWPRVGDVRGKFLFVLDAGGGTRGAYAEGHPNLAQRVMFATFPEDHPSSAFIILNDPTSSMDRIKRLVVAGYLVRTRADSGTVEARTGATTRRDQAFASGAQVVTTDYYEGRNPFGTGYCVVFPGGRYVRLNPVVARPTGQ